MYSLYLSIYQTQKNKATRKLKVEIFKIFQEGKRQLGVEVQSPTGEEYWGK